MYSVDGVWDQENRGSKEANSKVTIANTSDNLLFDDYDITALLKRARLNDPLIHNNVESDRESRSGEIETIQGVRTCPTLRPSDNVIIFVKNLLCRQKKLQTTTHRFLTCTKAFTNLQVFSGILQKSG